jgi:C-terminal processing protease CtpA/Prc
LPPASLRNWPAGSKPPQLGISWREDEGEPGAVFLTRVVDGTPAAAAGLAVHDRIYEVGGRQFADEKEFQSTILAMLSAGTPLIELAIERRGRISTVAVKMPTAGSAD